jgi:tRNA(Ile)-lysidine synthase
MSVVSTVRAFAARHRMWQPGTRVLVALSGGSDSVALFLILRELQATDGLEIAAVAHLNHAIRGAAADEDEAFCREIAARHRCRFVSSRVDVPAVARQRRVSIEVAARDARRAFLEEARNQVGADRTATAHTEDDQAETVLLRMVRGTGLRGLAGIAPANGVWIRPLLTIARQDLRDYLGAQVQGWREDTTNADLANPRNRMRHTVLPLLEEHFNPSARKALARLALLARDDDDALGAKAEATAPTVFRVQEETVVVDAARLQALPGALAARVVRLALGTLSGPRGIDFDHVEAVRAFARGEPASHVPGVRMEHSGTSVVLVGRGAGRVACPPFRVDLPIPGLVVVPGSGWTLEAEGPIERRGGELNGAGDRALVDAALLDATLVVRSRQPGDRLQPLGLNGRKKVQDLFVDRKVSRERRDAVPIVTDRHGQIVWVAGHALSAPFRVTERTNAVVILKLRRTEAPGGSR